MKKKSNKILSNIETINKSSKCEMICVNIICFLTFLAFAFVGIMSIFQTSVIDPDNYGAEKILYQPDMLVLNILFIALFIFALFKFKEHKNFFSKINIMYLEIGLIVYVLILGFIWIFSATSIPAADSYNVFETATGCAKGNYSSLINGQSFYNSDYYGGYSYYSYYPFQLGFVFICEIIYRIFGVSSAMPIEVINVLCVACAYLGIAKITKLLFNKKYIEFIAIMLLAGCFQPIFFSTFAYGNIIGMCCAIWASYFLIKYLKYNKYLLLIPCAVLLVLSTMAKYNNMIYLVAFVIILIIHTVKHKKWQSIAFALAICIATVGCSTLIIKSYESRANVSLTDGVSQVLYLDMGLNDSSMAPGWYNGIAMSTYKNNGLNNETATQQAWNDIDSRLKTFSANPSYTLDFFTKKILSQWNEPTYESVWVSKVKGHYNEINSVAKSVYDGSTGQFFELYFNFYMQILFILFGIGLFFLLYNKCNNIETILLPLILLGAFGYHLLFEGKSQYVLTYIILFIPTASYALYNILESKYSKLISFVNKLKIIPKEK